MLENLTKDLSQQPRNLSMKVSSAEKKVLKALRQLSSEELKLLENNLQAGNKEIRLALFALGRTELLTKLNEEELNQFQKILEQL